MAEDGDSAKRDDERTPRDGSDDSDVSRMFQLVHDRLRQIAAAQLKNERKDHTLQPTALVNEAWLRLAGDGAFPGGSRAGFFKAAAEAMRRILIDHARARGRTKRGAGRGRIALDPLELASGEDSAEILSVDEAIQRLHAMDERLAVIVKLRVFAGLSDSEIGEAVGVNERTVRRDWVLARAWLHRELGREESR